VIQQNESDAVIASGLTTSDRVVTTGFANLSDGAKVFIGKDDAAPPADLAPRKRGRAPDGKGGQSKDGQAKDGKRGEGDQKGQTGPAPASQQGGGAK
jgi:multidrug efflux system membrane fusion protein